MTLLHRPTLLLEIDLTSRPIEIESDDLLAKVRSRHRPRLRAILRSLYEAGSDPRVHGVIVKLGGGLSWATMQDLRAAAMAFAASGKPIVGWAETLGDSSSGTVDYTLATACTEIWLQPSGELGLLGVAAETTFLRGALDKLGIEPQLDKRHEFKNAADRIMRTEFTPEHHEAVDRLAASAWENAVDAIAQGRGLDRCEVRRLADTAPLSAAEALDVKLIDRVGYRDEAYAAVRSRIAGEPALLFADQWTPRRHAADLVQRHKAVVALVDGHGEIVSGRSRTGPRGPQLGSDTVSAALRAAREDDHVKAVVFRVDSPGGSAVASDTIWREVVLTREAGKPVVVSMGEMAGSGGYYIACPADAIVAQPSTITGSIGVFGGKIVVSDLMERIGLATGAVEHGARSRMFSTRRGFTDDERTRLSAMLDRIYAEFVSKVAEGRGMSFDAVHEVARGRVWSGADAADNGLVDRLGGMRVAADLAREKAGLACDAPLRRALHVPALARLGRPKSSEDPRARVATATAWGDLGALASALGLPGGGALRMPDVRMI